ncbi:MAG: hypothetical protein DMG80_16005 [Acidobacteria bacterium]|nr:MAG: hypothetical protein DMG80_16005 [Acidobacteriota bacterium]
MQFLTIFLNGFSLIIEEIDTGVHAFEVFESGLLCGLSSSSDWKTFSFRFSKSTSGRRPCIFEVTPGG